MRHPPRGVLVLILLAPLLSCGGGEGRQPIAVGGLAPDFSLSDLDGEAVDRRSLEGRPTVLSFWATWCRPCVKEVPVLSELAARGGVGVVAIALDEGGEVPVRRFVEEHRLSYTVLLGDEEVFRRFDGFGIPYTLVLDAVGRIVAIHRQRVELPQLEADLERAGAAVS